VRKSTPIVTARAARLLIRLRLQRQLNQALAGVGRLRRKAASARRAATPGKSRLGWLLASLIGASMLVSFTNLAYRAFSHMQERLGSTPAESARAAPGERGWLGAQIGDVTSEERRAFGPAQARGARIVKSIPGGPAAAAGLRAGDLVVSIDGRALANAADLADSVGGRAPGSTAELEILRGGKDARLRLTLGRQPPPPAGSRARRTPLPPAPGHILPLGVLQACALEVIVLSVATLLTLLAAREFSAPDWDLEWLVTLPVPLTTLLAVRIAERSLVNPTGLLTLWPFLSIASWRCGAGLAAPLIGLAVTLPLLVIIAAIWTMLDTLPRLWLRPPRLRNLQAIVSVAAVACFYLAMSPGLSPDSFVLGWAARLPRAIFLLPPGLAIEALASTATAVSSFLLLLAQGGACAALVVVFLNRQLGAGIVTTSGRESGRRGLAKLAPPAAGEPPEPRALLSPIQAREVALLLRDRNFLVQTLILPVVIMGGQILFNAPHSAFAFALSSPQHVAAAAFGVAAYALMFSAFQTLNAEGQALWILYCVPHSLQSILRQKAMLWGGVCLLYAIAVLGLSVAFHAPASLQLLQLSVVALVGIPIFAAIGVALGVFACDPLAQVIQRRVRQSYLYLYMLLASLYAYAIFASTIWQRMALVVLTALLALALWQKARDQLPYLLDPAASPPSRVGLADGLIAALLFFVLQGFAVGSLTLGEGALTGRVVLIAFLLAGGGTYGAMRLAYWRLNTEGVPRIFGPQLGRALLAGGAGGVGATIAAIAYLRLAADTPLLSRLPETIISRQGGVLWLALLAVVAAPIFEEFIFRGLIFAGLRRTLGLTASLIASAAIFALVHPPPAVIPVFGLGVAAALAYEATGVLLAPMLVHALYNAAVISYQAFASGL
jgi:membrane protease YdiL (CAAX protease family)